MRSWIPAHLKGTVGLKWVLMIWLAWYVSSDLTAPVGVITLLIGNFLDDQTVHLSQLNHSDADLSGLEAFMKEASWFVRPAGWIMAGAGIVLLVMARYTGP